MRGKGRTYGKGTGNRYTMSGGIGPEYLKRKMEIKYTLASVQRKVFPEVPPRVEYSLSETGITLKPVLNGLCEWGKTYQKSRRQE